MIEKVKSVLDIIRNFSYIKLYKRIDSLESATGYSDLHCLFILARDSRGEGAIVEIGAYKGKSSVVLALGSQAKSRGKVYSIDPHLEGTKDVFMQNLRNFGVADRVISIFATSEEARRGFNSGIRLLFIDGCHEYEFVKKDILLWKDLIIDGGVIVFHDINWKTVARAVDELVRPSREFIVEGTTGCSLIVSKGLSANKEILEEIRLFNRLKEVVRPWKILTPASKCQNK